MSLPRRFVIGLDGCKGGWVGVQLDLDEAAPPAALFFANFADALETAGRPAAIAVDMPIGFLDSAAPGGRTCERMTRALLGPRRSSVFSAPSRPALAHAEDYEAALEANRASGGVGLSLQSFHLMRKMNEIDAVMSPARQTLVRESHPELAFTELNGGRPMRSAKKTAHGRVERVAVLETAGAGFGLTRDFLDPKAHPVLRGRAARDDLIDAAAVALSAVRIARGEARRVPESPPVDAKGLRMEIVV
ncbi:MAG: DUF429 domain-containing protein [Maricaulaceae bacterium]|jgi:predicted RNase H-like nuclease